MIHGIPFISSFSHMAAGGLLVENTGYASAVWPSTNDAIVCPFRMGVRGVAKAMFCSNGATVSGNLDLAIYNKDGVRLTSTGEIGQTGASQLQVADVDDVLLIPGWYYMAIVLDNVTGTFIRNNSQAVDWAKEGCRRIASDACPLPANATLVAPTQSYMPEFGVAFQVVI